MKEKELTVSLSYILKKYRNSDEKGKKLLESIYGENVFKTEDITLKIKTVEDAFKLTGRPKIDFSMIPNEPNDDGISLRDKVSAEYEMYVVSEAINEGWSPDWDNSDQTKWRPWFIMSPSGFSFSHSNYDRSIAGSGSRLCFETEEKSNYVAKQFLDNWGKIQLG